MLQDSRLSRSCLGVFTTARFWVYLSCTMLAVLASCLLGKEMAWDNLDYHFYAGFSALQDRLGADYFAAGVESYLNPYMYAPFYALASTGLPALWIASALAAVQSVILWLTYELAVAVSPAGNTLRIAAGGCAALLALANPILINQLGSSFADITTAAIVLGGWLLLVQALRTADTTRVVWAGLLLGAASALKLTNSLHALSACVLLLFLPATWRGRVRLSLVFVAALALSFAAVAGPWAMRLGQHFGNPFFPLLNDIFRSPQFPAVSLADYRFVPSSLAEALWRPFAIALPITFVDDERASPDLRYALLVMVAVLALSLWAWRRFRRGPAAGVAREAGPARQQLIALACAFLVDWALWLRVSGNGRYFLAMSCVAGVLAVVLAGRLFASRRAALALLLTAVFAVQGVQLAFGTEYRAHIRWDGGPWFEVSVPDALRESRDLYFLMGEQSNSFVAPFLPKGSAFVNLDGGYVLGPGGASGARVRALIRQYSGHIRVAVMAGDFQLVAPKTFAPPDAAHIDDTLAFFGLRSAPTDCSTISVRNMRFPWREVLPAASPMNLQQVKANLLRVPQSPAGYLLTCAVVRDLRAGPALVDAERGPDVTFDRMESECPLVFQPSRPVTEVYGDARHGYIWMRKYASSNLTAFIDEGFLELVDGARGGRPEVLGRQGDWIKGLVRLSCGRHAGRYYVKAIAPAR